MRLPSLFFLRFTGLAVLSGSIAAQNIYTCVDGKGRTITADRPIVECIDRTQRELSQSGLLKRQMGPSLTAHEQAVQDEKDRRSAEIRAREAEDRRRDKALLLRYPARPIHDQERAVALAQIDEVIKAARKRQGELADQRKVLDGEMEFYVKDPSKMPALLKRRLEENQSSVAVQQKFILVQAQDKKRVNSRFDEELARLNQLWASVRSPVPPALSAPSAVKN